MAPGLTAAQFGGGAVEAAQSGGAGAIDGLLERVENRIDHGIVGQGRNEPILNGGAAAETPGGVDDFSGKSFLDGAFGREFGLEAVAEFRVEVLFAGMDEVAAGVEAGSAELRAARALPRAVAGPVEDWALRRLAAIWAAVDMVVLRFEGSLEGEGMRGQGRLGC